MSNLKHISILTTSSLSYLLFETDMPITLYAISYIGQCTSNLFRIPKVVKWLSYFFAQFVANNAQVMLHFSMAFFDAFTLCASLITVFCDIGDIFGVARRL